MRTRPGFLARRAAGPTRGPDHTGGTATTTGKDDPERPHVGAAGLVLAAALSTQFGAAFATMLFPHTGAAGAVTLRLTLSALVLLAIARPRVRGYRRTDWLAILAFGLAMAAMNHLFYEAIARIPLGTAVTLELLGPLVLSVIAGRWPQSLVWAVMAFAGAAALTGATLQVGSLLGVAFALGAGTMWACYTLTSRRAGDRFPRLDGLALAMTVSAALSLPVGISSAGAALLSPRVLLIGLAVALMSSTLPYALELVSLRTLPPSTFAVLLSLNPVVASAAGLVVLDQALGPVELTGILLVVAASAGAVHTAARAHQSAATGSAPG